MGFGVVSSDLTLSSGLCLKKDEILLWVFSGFLDIEGPGFRSSWVSSGGTVGLSSLGPSSSKSLPVVGRPIRSAQVCRN